MNFKRFSRDGFFTSKLNDEVKYPSEGLDLAPFVVDMGILEEKDRVEIGMISIKFYSICCFFSLMIIWRNREH